MAPTFSDWLRPIIFFGATIFCQWEFNKKMWGSAVTTHYIYVSWMKKSSWIKKKVLRNVWHKGLSSVCQITWENFRSLSFVLLRKSHSLKSFIRFQYPLINQLFWLLFLSHSFPLFSFSLQHVNRNFMSGKFVEGFLFAHFLYEIIEWIHHTLANIIIHEFQIRSSLSKVKFITEIPTNVMQKKVLSASSIINHKC